MSYFYLVFESKMEGRYIYIEFQIAPGHWINKPRILSYIQPNLLTLFRSFING